MKLFLAYVVIAYITFIGVYAVFYYDLDSRNEIEVWHIALSIIAGIFWPIAIPIIIVSRFIDYTKHNKENKHVR